MFYNNSKNFAKQKFVINFASETDNGSFFKLKRNVKCLSPEPGLYTGLFLRELKGVHT